MWAVKMQFYDNLCRAHGTVSFFSSKSVWKWNIETISVRLSITIKLSCAKKLRTWLKNWAISWGNFHSSPGTVRVKLYIWKTKTDVTRLFVWCAVRMFIQGVKKMVSRFYIASYFPLCLLCGFWIILVVKFWHYFLGHPV